MVFPTIWAVVRDGRIELEEQFPLPEGSRVLVTAVPAEAETAIWHNASQPTLDEIWNNSQDDVYAQLLKK